MKYRELGKTGLKVSEISFGTWGIGGDWGNVDDETSLQALHTAIEHGVNFFDTADVYGSGRSEQLLAQATKGKEDSIYIATKFCRQGDIHDPHTYAEKTVRAYCEASLKRLNRERIDLYQIHCPPLEILKQGEVFHVLDQLQAEGKIRNYGVSVESVEEGLFCMEQPNVAALQVIFNIFRQKVSRELLPVAAAKNVGILVRLPLASGLLTGKFNETASFDPSDHRNYNRNGEAFNVGETFAGLPLEKGQELSRALSWISEGKGNMTRASLRWILEHKAVSTVIPGFKNSKQVLDNLAASETPGFTKQELEQLERFYDEQVHQFIRGSY